MRFRTQRADVRLAAIRILFVALAAIASCCQPGNAAEAPQRVVSFNVCADQLVVALADPAQIAGLSPYATDPTVSTVTEQARKFRKLNWQAESTIPLNPDLVLVGSWDRSLTQRLLRALGFRVVAVDVIADLAAARAQIRSVAALLGHPDRGEALIAEIDAAQRRLAQAGRGAASTALLVGNGGYTVGPQSLAAALMKEAGLKAPSGAPAGYGGFVPLEKLIELRPDVLVVSNMLDVPDGQGAMYLTHPALRELYPPSQRILLPSRFTLCGGPSLIAAFDYLTGVVTRFGHKP
jgi:iron complex transport system substrate-binding protein